MKKMNAFLLLSILNIFLLACSPSTGNDQKTDSDQTEHPGKVLFKTNCATCHFIHTDMVGPALWNVQDRRSEEWLVSFIRNPKEMIASGDSIAVAIYDKWNRVEMTPPIGLTDEEIVLIIDYIAEESINFDAPK